MPTKRKTKQEVRLANLRILMERYGIEPGDFSTTSAEDLQPYLDGETRIARWAAVTFGAGNEGPIHYITPSSQTLLVAQRQAVMYADDDTYAEFPVACVDLDTMRTFKPEWDLMDWAQADEDEEAEA